jgi:hypothetical protein
MYRALVLRQVRRDIGATQIWAIDPVYETGGWNCRDRGATPLGGTFRVAISSR